MKTKRMVFRLIVTLSLLALLVVPASPAAAADTPVSIDVAAQVSEGSDFDVTINITGVADFDAAQFDVSYNATVIQVTGVTSGNISGTPIPVSQWGYIPASTQGTIRVINNVGGTPGVSGSGYLAKIHFHVVGAAGTSTGSTDIDLHDGILGDKYADEISATWTGGSIEVIAAVTAGFSADKTEVLVGQSITFTDSTSGGSGSYTYAWNFGDAGTSTEANPTHSYATPGNYTVALTVTDTSDGSDTETKTNYITVYAPLVAGASSDINEAVVGQSITFTDSTSGGKTSYTYAWDFGDTGTSTEANPTHSYSDFGTYDVSLTVTDSLGNTDDTTVTVTVYKLGDADGNGTVEVLDLTYVELIIMGDSGHIYTTWADANSSGDINALDLTAIELIIIP